MQRHPKIYAQQPVLAAVDAASGPALLSRPISAAIDYAAGERLQFRIRRAAAGPSQPAVTFTCRLSRYGTAIGEDFKVLEGALSAPVVLDKFLAGQPLLTALRLNFVPAAPGQEHTIEARYTPVGASDAIIKTDTVRGQDVLFLLPGYAMTRPSSAPQASSSSARIGSATARRPKP